MTCNGHFKSISGAKVRNIHLCLKLKVSIQAWFCQTTHLFLAKQTMGFKAMQLDLYTCARPYDPSQSPCVTNWDLNMLWYVFFRQRGWLQHVATSWARCFTFRRPGTASNDQHNIAATLFTILRAGGRRGPRGAVANKDLLWDPCKRTC